MDKTKIAKSLDDKASAWTSKHTRILLLTSRGDKAVSDISQAVGLSTSQVERIRRTNIFQTKYRELTERVQTRVFGKFAESEANKAVDKAREHLQKSALRAARKVTGILRKGTPQDRIRFDAAVDILDRVGVKAAQVIETHERVYDPQEVQSASQTLIELETHLERVSNEGSPYVLKSPKSLEPSTPESSQTDKGSMQENSTPDLAAPTVDTPSVGPVSQSS